MNKGFKKLGILLISILVILFSWIIIKTFFVPKERISMQEKAIIKEKFTTFPKHTVYHVTLQTMDTNTTFDVVIDKDDYDNFQENETVDIKYKINDFKYLTDTVSDIFINNKSTWS